MYIILFYKVETPVRLFGTFSLLLSVCVCVCEKVFVFGRRARVKTTKNDMFIIVLCHSSETSPL